MPSLQSRQSFGSRAAATRSLQDTSSCSSQQSLATTYNDDPAVPVYVGVMFSITPNVAININGLDVDIRLDMVTAPDDFAIQVYTVLGEIADSYMDPSVWTLVANTTSVMAPEMNGIIVPAQAFTPISAIAGERRSFYLSMTKRLIDSTVYALDKTDEPAFEGTDLSTYVGVGFDAPNFPGAYDTTVDPQFAGTIYYELASSECAAIAETTTRVYFDFLFSKQVTALGNVNQIVSTTMEQLMKEIPELQQFQALYSLKVSSIVTTPTEYTGGCPEAWDSCTSFFQSAEVVFSHLSTLSSNELTYDVYKLAGSVTTAVQQGIKSVDVFYIGLESISADYQVTLDGVPAGVSMDEIQAAYFSETTSRFLAAGEQALSLPVYQVSIDAQQPSRRRLLRALQTSELGSSVVTGQLRGAKYHYLLDEEYVSNLKSEFDSNYQLYMDKLRLDGLRPGPINHDNRYTYFSNITTVNSLITFKEATVPQEAFPDIDANGMTDSKGGLDSALIAVIAAAGGVVVLIVGCIIFASLRRMNRDMVKLRDDDGSESVVYDSRNTKQTTTREAEFSVHDKPQRRRSYSGTTGTGSLDNFMDQRQPRQNRTSGARSVELLPVSKGGNGAAGMTPSAIEHNRRAGQKRPQNGGSDNRSLSGYIDKQPRPGQHHMSGSRSLGPGAVPDRNYREQVKQTSTMASEQSLLGCFLDKQPRQNGTIQGGARSVQESAPSQRLLSHSSEANHQNAPALGGYLDGQSRRQDKMNASKSVDGDAPRRGGKRPGKVGLDYYMAGQAAPSNPMGASRSVGPGVEMPRELSPEEKWGPLPKPPSMKRLAKTQMGVLKEPIRGVRRVKSLDATGDFEPAEREAYNNNRKELHLVTPAQSSDSPDNATKFSTPPAAAAAAAASEEPKTAPKEPTRGVRRSKSMDDAADFGQSERGVGRAKKKKPPSLASLQGTDAFDNDGGGKKIARNRGIRLEAL